MNLISKFFHLLFHKPRTLISSVFCKLSPVIPDKQYLECMYYLQMGKKLNLKNPQTFTEKIQWLKLYNRNPEYTTMVDKLAVKDFVAQRIGDEYIIPTLCVWEKPEDINFDSLPDKFVLKTTHGGGSGGVVICKDKATFDRKKAISRLNKSLQQDIYRNLKEWPYKDVPKRIIAEQYLEPDITNNDLRDYKMFCFNGKPKYCQVIGNRSGVMTVDFFDKNWNHQPFHEPRNTPFSSQPIERPTHLELMWKLAEKLAEDKAFSRIDFYEVNDKVLFGEITFFPTSG